MNQLFENLKLLVFDLVQSCWVRVHECFISDIPPNAKVFRVCTDRSYLMPNLTLLYKNEGNNDKTLYNVCRGLVVSWSNLDYLIGIILIIVSSIIF